MMRFSCFWMITAACALAFGGQSHAHDSHGLLGFKAPKLAFLGVDYVGLSYGQISPDYTSNATGTGNDVRYPEENALLRGYVGFNLSPRVSLEIGYEGAEEESRVLVSGGTSEQTIGYEAFYVDVLSRIPLGQSLHPVTQLPLWQGFASAGVGRYFLDRRTVNPGGDNTFADNETALRLGVGVERTLTNQWAFRAQAQYSDLTMGGLADRATTFSVGLNYKPKAKVDAKDI